MAPKFPNPDPATDSVRDRLNQFVEVAGRAVYPPLAVAPSPTTAGQVWWDISDTIKIRNEANTAWASLATTTGAVSFKESQTLTSGEKTQALANLGAATKLPAAGAVESLIFAYHTAGAVTYGGTYAGANLRATGAATSIYIIVAGFTAQAGLGFIPSGTWVCLGNGVNSSTTAGVASVDFAYLFQRIA